MLHSSNFFFSRCRIPCGILYLQLFYTVLLHIFLLFSIETQSANNELSKNKVPKNYKQNKKNVKKNKHKIRCIFCSQPTAKTSRTILGWLSFLVEIILICIPNLWVELYCILCNVCCFLLLFFIYIFFILCFCLMEVH